jgi:hypothetical protein
MACESWACRSAAAAAHCVAPAAKRFSSVADLYYRTGKYLLYLMNLQACHHRQTVV